MRNRIQRKRKPVAVAQYPLEVKAEALALAEEIAKIEDHVKRVGYARARCLDFVIRYSKFPEEDFLALCRATVADIEGPALRVKKTKHGVRTSCDDGSRWGDIWREGRGTAERRRRVKLSKESSGHASENGAFQEEYDDTDPVAGCCLGNMNGELLPVYVWQSRMW